MKTYFSFNISKKYNIIEDLQKLSHKDLFFKLIQLTNEKIASSQDVKHFGKKVDFNIYFQKNDNCTVDFLTRRGYTKIEFSY